MPAKSKIAGEAIKAGTASIKTDHIECFTETGIRLKSGEELAADIAYLRKTWQEIRNRAKTARPTSLVFEDLTLAQQAAETADADTPLGAAARALYAQFVEEEDGFSFGGEGAGEEFEGLGSGLDGEAWELGLGGELFRAVRRGRGLHRVGGLAGPGPRRYRVRHRPGGRRRATTRSSRRSGHWPRRR